ncbi:MAG: ABC transporter ATP-binding protein, partial [Christensenellaceae bacterium]|nr:ABC transporter ATP-binding protein [Christensenellaceae bacterium]
MIEIKNLVKKYRCKNRVIKTALNGVSYKFPETGLVFILGKSGSGKTTMLNILGLLDNYDRGDLIINGKSTKKFTQNERDNWRALSVGFVFQEFHIIEKYNIAQNISLSLEIQCQNPDKARVADVLETVGLSGFEKRKAHELSGGQKQRVAIARALIKNPEIILADEPTGSLDSVNSATIFSLLKKLSSEKLIIVISHDNESANKYADEIVELKDGKIKCRKLGNDYYDTEEIIVDDNYDTEKVDELLKNGKRVILTPSYKETPNAAETSGESNRESAVAAETLGESNRESTIAAETLDERHRESAAETLDERHRESAVVAETLNENQDSSSKTRPSDRIKALTGNELSFSTSVKVPQPHAYTEKDNFSGHAKFTATEKDGISGHAKFSPTGKNNLSGSHKIRLSMRSKIKLAGLAMRAKWVRTMFTILISMFAVAFIGFSTIISAFSVNKVLKAEIERSDLPFINVEATTYNGNGILPTQTSTNMYDDLESSNYPPPDQIGVEYIKKYEFCEYSFPYNLKSYTDYFPTIGDYFAHSPSYYGIIEIDDLAKLGLRLSAGRMPENVNEAVITNYSFETYKQFGISAG